MPFIKSHSNYVLKKKHQDITDGTIFERDITTIGGLNQFAKGQVPIYRSSNFIITVNATTTPSKEGGKSKWIGNDESEVWNLSNLSGMVVDDKTQDDTAVVLKQDYYDFTDFAYFGSLMELFRVSLGKILSTFPGELYAYEDYPYIWHDGDRLNPTEHVLGVECPGDDTTGFEELKPRLDNPYGINIHSVSKPVGGEPIKYFANGGYKNYDIVVDTDGVEGEPEPITKWAPEPFLHKFETLDCLNARYGSYIWYTGGNIQYGYGDTASSTTIAPIREIISQYAGKNGITEEQFTELEKNFFSGDARAIYDTFDEHLSSRRWFPSGTNVSAYTESEFAEYITAEGETDETTGEKYVEYGGVKYFASDYDKLTNYDACDSVDCFIGGLCIGDKCAHITINDQYEIGAWWGDGWEIKYIPEGDNTSSYHIRPNKEVYQRFYNGLNNFERLLVSNKTTPRYKAWFSVISENDYGYTRQLQSFVLPTGHGGYNIDYEGGEYSRYVGRLGDIANFYDERFCDNLWRNLTHEAIQNFDWTYTRDYNEGDEVDFILGGERMRKLIRIYGRGLDDVKMFADSLKTPNTVTYNGRGNTPDYFLTDLLEMDGWDVVSPIPFSLLEKDWDAEANQWNAVTDYADEEKQLENDNIIRVFSQNAATVVYPYRNCMFDNPYGYFVTGYINTPPYQNITTSSSSDQTSLWTDECGLRYRIRDYHDNARFYTFFDTMNEFYRRLKINSRYLWRKKGTIEGIESLLSLFGLKSQRWVDSISLENVKKSLSGKVDFDTEEYTSFANRIEETWNPSYEMYEIDRVNSTKTIRYDYRSISNDTIKEAGFYYPYQGLGVVARYADDGDVKGEYLDSDNKPTNDVDEAVRYTTPSLTHENYVRRRFLYPTNSPVLPIDGDPYFQMDGGWRATSLWGKNNESAYNISYDKDDNIIWNKKEMNPRVDNDVVYDDHPIYKETIRNIKSVGSIAELLSLPYLSLHDGSIIHVRSVENNIAIIDGKIYPIQFEYYTDPNNNTEPTSKVYKYIQLTCFGKSVSIGDADIYGTLYTYNRLGNEILHDLSEKPDGFEIKAYITEDGKFTCHGGNNGLSTVTSFGLYTDSNTGGYSNYFVLDDVEYFDRLQPIVEETAANTGETQEDSETPVSEEGQAINPDRALGWRRLKTTDYEYHKVQLIENYYKGNNPHNGNMSYDSGHEYFMHLKQLFKYPIDNDLFDERCYDDLYWDIENTIKNYGFKGLVHEDEAVKCYDDLMTSDGKIHYFGNYKARPESKEAESVPHAPEPNITQVYIYTQRPSIVSAYTAIYRAAYGTGTTVTPYTFTDENSVVYGVDKSGQTLYDNTYTGRTDETVDNVTNQIVNNKRFDLKLNLHSGETSADTCGYTESKKWGENWFGNDGQTELKYMEDVIMHYTEQLIPSTAIWSVKYMTHNELEMCK